MSEAETELVTGICSAGSCLSGCSPYRLSSQLRTAVMSEYSNPYSQNVLEVRNYTHHYQTGNSQLTTHKTLLRKQVWLCV